MGVLFCFSILRVALNILMLQSITIILIMLNYSAFPVRASSSWFLRPIILTLESSLASFFPVNNKIVQVYFIRFLFYFIILFCLFYFILYFIVDTWNQLFLVGACFFYWMVLFRNHNLVTRGYLLLWGRPLFLDLFNV